MRRLTSDRLQFSIYSGRKAVKRIAAFAVVLFFTVFSVLSAAFILAGSGHIHDHNGSGGSCIVCSSLARVKEQIEMASTAFICAVILSVGLLLKSAVPQLVRFCERLQTLFGLKVKLNN